MSPTVDLTSGYFGLSKLYQSFVLQSGVRTELLCASPQVRRQPWYLSVSLIVALSRRQMGSTIVVVYLVAYPKHTRT